MYTQNLIIRQVWSKGRVIPGYSPAIWRYDACGAIIKWGDYGNCNSQFGWEMDHIIPEALGGSNHISNLRPLQWENNRTKSDGRLICVRPKRIF